MNELDFPIILAQIINISIIFLIFKKFVADHLNEKLSERKSHLKKLEEADSYYAKKIEEADKEKQELMKKAKVEANSFLSQSENIANRKAEEIIKKANKNVIYIIEWWKMEVEKERLKMLEKLRESAINLSLELNKKLFDQTCSTNSFVEKQVKKIK